MRPSVAVNRRMRRLTPERRGAALLLALAAGAFVCGCHAGPSTDCTSSENPGYDRVSVHPEIAALRSDQSAGRGTDYADFREIRRPRKSGNAPPANRSAETGSHREQPGSVAHRAGSQPAVCQGFAGAGAEAV